MIRNVYAQIYFLSICLTLRKKKKKINRKSKNVPCLKKKEFLFFVYINKNNYSINLLDYLVILTVTLI